ncbi:MAG: quaternary ammonium compound-resistance protein SugE, partial [Pseudonocardiales bacterium]|nr:quaternary ammonium compound-resistance protein SugE [Pseudonocardiales bacterium]
MSTGWALLLAAGVVEIAWAQSIPPTEGFTRFWPSLLCL